MILEAQNLEVVNRAARYYGGAAGHGLYQGGVGPPDAVPMKVCAGMLPERHEFLIVADVSQPSYIRKFVAKALRSIVKFAAIPRRSDDNNRMIDCDAPRGTKKLGNSIFRYKARHHQNILTGLQAGNDTQRL
ncbi:hypothetical protein ASG92_10015 [Arthrobacter sp. Soil736]|nr:hypothetical protein ASG92_10015 [Arthrobacter sp. Soil736]